MKVLLLGCKGQLGRCIVDQMKKTNFDIFAFSRDQMDITDFEKSKKKILAISPDLIINASAYTAVDKAEEEPEIANLINHLSVKNIAQICSQINSWLVHISTDYVFNGNAQNPYKENNKTDPRSIYGKTKLNGELAIKSIDCKHIIIRTAWVYSEYGNNFLKTMLQLGSKREVLEVIDDQVGCPTYAQDLAKAIINILPSLNSQQNIIGTYHYAGNTRCSWANFAEDIFTKAKKYEIIKVKPKVSKISTSDFPTLAERPKQSMLDSSLIKSTFGINSSDYEQGINSVISVLKDQKISNR